MHQAVLNNLYSLTINKVILLVNQGLLQLIMNKKLTILLADNHSILRTGLCSILNSKPNLEVIAEADNGIDAVKTALLLKPDLLITDLSMPKKNGTEVIIELKKRLPELKSIVLTMHSGDEYIQPALTAGANGYILKDDSHEEILAAIESVINGNIYLSPSICGNDVQGYLNTSNSDHKPTTAFSVLTKREKEILKLIAEGYRSKDIAELLSISIKTVDKHRTNLMKKLGLHSISNLTIYAIQNGLVNPN